MPNPYGAGQDLTATPPHIADPESHRQVRVMAACGLTSDQICQVLPCSRDDFDRCYTKTFADALLQANVRVGTALLQAASNPQHDQFFQCASFWMRARAGWRDVREIKTDAKLPDEQKQALIDTILQQMNEVKVR